MYPSDQTHDTDLELFIKAERAAKAGNARMAEAIARLERMNVKMEQLLQERQTLVNLYEQLERAIINEAKEL